MKERLGPNLAAYAVLLLSAMVSSWLWFRAHLMMFELPVWPSVVELAVIVPMVLVASTIVAYLLVIKPLRRRHVGDLIILGACLQTAALALSLSVSTEAVFWLDHVLDPIGWFLIWTGALTFLLQPGQGLRVVALLCLAVLARFVGHATGPILAALMYDFLLFGHMIAIAAGLGLVLILLALYLRRFKDVSSNDRGTGFAVLARVPAATVVFLLTVVATDAPVQAAFQRLIDDSNQAASVLVQILLPVAAIGAVYLLSRRFALTSLLVGLVFVLPAIVLALMLISTESSVSLVVLAAGLAFGVMLPLVAQAQICSHIPTQATRPTIACMLLVFSLGSVLWNLTSIAGMFPSALLLLGLLDTLQAMRLVMWWPEHAVYVLSLIAWLVMCIVMAVAFLTRNQRRAGRPSRPVTDGTSASDRAWLDRADDDIRRRF